MDNTLTAGTGTRHLTETDYRATIAAAWLVGLQSGWTVRGTPRWVDRQRHADNYRTAREILDGGTFRGPLAVYRLVDYVRELSRQVPPALNL